MRYRLGADVGGTFTDLVLLDDDGTVAVHKLRSTPDDFSRAILDGLHSLLAREGVPPQSVAEVIHGATVASNALLEHKGALTGLITTKGFRDVLEIGRLRMPRLYDMTWRKPRPLVERFLRMEVTERVDARGQVVTPLDMAEAEAAVRHLLEQGVESVAVCFLHSYANPSHEEAVGAILRRLAPNLFVSLSCQVLPEVKEFERTSTTVINAYLQPVVKRYLASLEAGLREKDVTAPLLMMQSNGGVITAASAGQKPIHIIESGPAAGVIGAMRLGHRAGISRLISFDMGGTTAKAATVEEGRVARYAEYEVGGELNTGQTLSKGGGYLVRVPAIELAEVGSGGGSIAWVDKGGVLQVGPQSAGASPGPACYNAGGTQPTVTDANVVLGYLNPLFLVGGDLPLDADEARRAVTDHIAGPLGLSTTEAAWGIHSIATARMVRAVRAVTTEKGRNPADFTLVGFGGSGPVHAAGIAGHLGVRRVVVPPMPGLFSSVGLLFADLEHHYVQTFWSEAGKLSVEELGHRLARMEEEGRGALLREGFPPERVEISRFVDMRYAWQNFELSIPIPNGELTAQTMQALTEAFHGEHEKTFGYRSQEAVQVVALRLVARGVPERPRAPERLLMRARSGSRLTRGARRAYFGADHASGAAGEWRDTPVLLRADLQAGPQPGPLVIEEYDATTVVPPGARAWLDEWGNIIIEMGG
ncbi:MAG: hydantoinase/oxoprolinase family protein [Chloroflexi bacterium]|nr:hydantoinase/oxoprolinase family protein [Chloroflexota bacterium]